ncbi:hypothetical protein [Roseinatronobacter sp. NSM]|uniref:hypothetical protein n=1 Tax=Roseinatronobacter sp. NSM TaxID=3457785 RepID=UPI0040364C06
MTDAMSRREIEDVLSSIRRLVAQDPPRQKGPVQGQADPEQGGDTGPGKLILTSALRVPADQTVVESVETGQGGPVAAAGNTAPHSPDLHHSRDAQDSPAPQPDTPDGAALAAGIGAPAGAPNAVHMLRVMNQRHADQKAAHDPSPDTAPDTDGDVSLEATLARLEQVLAQGQNPSSPATATDTNTTPAQPDPPHMGADDPVIDEAMLQQIVANIVRQELQGELGERITRNIRKLVRAEVARELQLRKS